MEELQLRSQAELRKNNVTLKKLQEQQLYTNVDWFFFENRIKKMTLDMLEPIASQQKKHQRSVATVLEKLDLTNYSMEGLLFELHSAKEAVKTTEYLKGEVRDLTKRMFALEEKQENRYNEMASKHMTFNEKQKSNENQLRIAQNSITLFNTEIKTIHKIVCDQRDNANLLIKRALDEVTQKSNSTLLKTERYEEKLLKQNTQIENCKNLLVQFEKNLNEMREKQKNWQKTTERELIDNSEAVINVRMKLIESNQMDSNRVVSDVKSQILEVENYMVNYQPYNTKLDILKMLFYTIQDNSYFNELVDYSHQLKQSFHDDLEEISSRMVTLNKKRVDDMEIPLKKRIQVQEFKFKCPHYKKEIQQSQVQKEILDDLHVKAEPTVISKKVEKQIRDQKRRMSQRILKRVNYSNDLDFGFVKELKTTSKDDQRQESIREQPEFKMSFNVYQMPMINIPQNPGTLSINLGKSNQQQQAEGRFERSPTKKLNKLQSQGANNHTSRSQARLEDIQEVGVYQDAMHQSHDQLKKQDSESSILESAQRQLAQNHLNSSVRKSAAKNVISQVIQQTVVKQVTDDKTLADIATLKRQVDFLKKESKSNSDDIAKGLQDQKRNFNTLMTQQQKTIDVQVQKQLQAMDKQIHSELKEMNTALTTLINTKYEQLDQLLQASMSNTSTSFNPLQTQGSSQLEKPSSSQSKVKVDEGDIKRIVNANIHRVTQHMNTQMTELKTSVTTQLKELGGALQQLQNYDRDLKMSQVQIKQLYKELRQTSDKFGEQVFNIEEKAQEFQKTTMGQYQQQVENFNQMIRNFENGQEAVLQKLEENFIQKIQEGIATAFPAFNLQMMDQVNALLTQVKEFTQVEIQAIHDDLGKKLADVQQFNMEYEVKLYQERSKREIDDKNLYEKLDTKISELKQLLEIKFSRKAKTKVDFLIEIRNMHQQMKSYNQKIKESQSQQEVIVDLFHYVKLMELEMMKVNQYLNYFEAADTYHNQDIQSLQQQQQVQQLVTFQHAKSLRNNENDPIRRISLKEQLPAINIERPNQIKLEQLNQNLEYFESRVGQMKSQIKQQMKDKSSSFQTTHDLDVEIDYIADQLGRMQQEQIMQVQITNLKQSQAQERAQESDRKSIFKSTTSRMSTLEKLLINSNQSSNQKAQNSANKNGSVSVDRQNPHSISVQDQATSNNYRSQGGNPNENNPYQLDDTQRKTSKILQSHSPNTVILNQLNISESKKHKSRDITPIQMKTQLLGAAKGLLHSRNSNYPHQLYNNHNISQQIESSKSKHLSTEILTLSDRTFDTNLLNKTNQYNQQQQFFPKTGNKISLQTIKSTLNNSQNDINSNSNNNKAFDSSTSQNQVKLSIPNILNSNTNNNGQEQEKKVSNMILTMSNKSVPRKQF
eukprot:403330703